MTSTSSYVNIITYCDSICNKRSSSTIIRRPRTCLHLGRNSGGWTTVGRNISEARLLVLNQIRERLKRYEYHKFQNFYSVLLMALVDSHCRFMRGSLWFPGNSHDSIIFQSTELWEEINVSFILDIGKMVGDIIIHPW